MRKHNRERRCSNRSMPCQICGREIEFPEGMPMPRPAPHKWIVCPACEDATRQTARESEARLLHLTRLGVEKAELLYLRSVEGGAAEPVVFVLDVREPVANAIAKAIKGCDAVTGLIADHRARGVEPILTLAVPVADITDEMLPPRVIETLRLGTPAGTFALLVCAAGGLRCSYVPIPAAS